jgi:Kdo2-lipid IVA lauroyltransferase/acyltransferase
MKPETLAGLLYRATALLTSLPWPWLRALADALAWVWRRLDARESKVARRNLQLSYPELLPSQRDELQRRILRTTARQAFETLRFWTRPPADNLARLRERHGEAIYDAALASGKGLIVVAPHFGNWELLNQWLSSRGPIAIVYNPPESKVGDAFLLRVRGADNIRQVRAEGPAVRQLWKTLKEGGAVGILPDQQPKLGDGEFAPFFGVQALTMTLVSRLAERTGATVLFAWCERTSADLEFALHVEPAPDGIADSDPVAAATTLNAMIERIARRDPAQYQWTYKRYGARPPGSGEPNPYKEQPPA